MTNSNKSLLSATIIILLFNSFTTYSKLAVGDNGCKGKTFKFKIGCHEFCTKNDSFQNFFLFISSSEKLKDNKYTIAKASRIGLSGFDDEKRKQEGVKFFPLCPEKIKLNTISDVPNPLYGAKISHLCLIDEYPIVVKDEEQKIYFLSYLTDDEKQASLYSTSIINDANKQPTSQIIKIAAAENSGIYGSYIFAAVKNNKKENFGAEGSGIALIYINEQEKKINDKKTKFIELRVVNADNADKSKNEEIISSNESKVKKDKDNEKDKIIKRYIPIAENKASAINGKIDAIKINNDAQITSDVLDMHWDKRLGRLYIALNVKSNSLNNSGARAVIVGRIQNHKLHFNPIAPNSAIYGNNQIIATSESNQEVTIQKIRTMHTSTLLNYLIVVGKNGSENLTGNKVYALPLVNKSFEKNFNLETDIYHGTLAKYDQLPKEYFNNEFFKNKGRVFNDEATNANDLLTEQDQAAKVGNGDLPLMPNEKIKDIFVVNDAVFICIANDNNNNTTQSGVFHSQAIFDSKGRIKSWSAWQRIGSTDNKIIGANLDIFTNQFWAITKHNVRYTNWSKFDENNNYKNHQTGLTSLLNKYFDIKHDGIHEIFDFPKTTLGFQNFSILIATGLNKIALLKTGSEIKQIYKPTKGNYIANSVYSNDGTFPKIDKSTKAVLMSGGNLNQIGSINAVDIATNINTQEHWLIIGGVDGLACLINKNGKTFSGDIADLNQLQSNLIFKKIGNYSLIKKIQSDGQFLYVLTDKKLDRIKLSSNDFKSGNIQITTLANLEQRFKNITFSDFAISNKFALLATSIGLFRVGNNKDIRIAKDMHEINWTLVNVPESHTYISKLLFITPTNKISDFAYKGQLYVLSSYRGLNQSRLNRFFINLENQINDSTIEPLPDFFIKDKLSNFFDFGTFKENIWTDGVLILSTTSKDNDSALTMQSLGPKVQSGIRSLIPANAIIDLDINNEKNFQIGRIIRNSANGALLINGNFGLRINA